jgi:hypothetical protein
MSDELDARVEEAMKLDEERVELLLRTDEEETVEEDNKDVIVLLVDEAVTLVLASVELDEATGVVLAIEDKLGLSHSPKRDWHPFVQ